jgi:ATP-dependent Clp protease ATP-binding subunit ClpA
MGQESPRSYPFGQFDEHSKEILTSAQREVEARGGKYLVSGLILLAAASRDDSVSRRLLQAMKTDLATLTSAVDADWKASRSQFLLDRPVTLIKEAIFAVGDSTHAPVQAGVEDLIVAMLGYEDSMASRVVTRLGIAPEDVVTELSH